MPDPMPTPPPQPVPPGIVGAATSALATATRWTDKQINNAFLFILAAAVGFLIYVDRRDRAEANGQAMRFFESQSEQNRLVVMSNTVAVQSISVQVGKLESTVNNLHRTVTAMGKGVDPEDAHALAPMPKVKPITPTP